MKINKNAFLTIVVHRWVKVGSLELNTIIFDGRWGPGAIIEHDEYGNVVVEFQNLENPEFDPLIHEGLVKDFNPDYVVGVVALPDRTAMLVMAVISRGLISIERDA